MRAGLRPAKPPTLQHMECVDTYSDTCWTAATQAVNHTVEQVSLLSMADCVPAVQEAI